MNSLINYRKLSKENKRELTEYLIYRSIEDNCREHKKELSDEKILDIKELAYDFYLDDCCGKLSITSITDFIINNYLDNNITLEELQDADYADLYSAIDEDCIELIKEQEEDLER